MCAFLWVRFSDNMIVMLFYGSGFRERGRERWIFKKMSLKGRKERKLFHSETWLPSF